MWKVVCSIGSAEYQVMKASVMYAYETTRDVSSTTLARLSKCHSVSRSSIPSSLRIGISRVITIATPEKIAPATKYGAKIVLCQPGFIAIAKSHETPECTDSTSGVANPAIRRYAIE